MAAETTPPPKPSSAPSPATPVATAANNPPHSAAAAAATAPPASVTPRPNEPDADVIHIPSYSRMCSSPRLMLNDRVMIRRLVVVLTDHLLILSPQGGFRLAPYMNARPGTCRSSSTGGRRRRTLRCTSITGTPSFGGSGRILAGKLLSPRCGRRSSATPGRFGGFSISWSRGD